MILLQYGWTALHQAYYNGHTKVAELLLNNHADIATIDNVRNIMSFM